MKDLKVFKDNRRIKSMSDIEKFESDLDLRLPDFLKEFILKYEGGRPVSEQRCYQLGNESSYELNQILYLRKSGIGGASIEAIFEGHKFYGIEGFIPFGIDSGGWDFNVSINEDTYGQVWVNKFDSGEEDPMEFVALSFEDFINGLESERL
jgi:cell wall assembly regulator SMI1